MSADDLAGRLREDIRSGTLPEGARLPSITELMAEHGIGRGAAQQALNTLRAEGAIASRHGAGNFVQSRFARTTRSSPGRLSRQRWGGGQSIQEHDTGGRGRSFVLRVDEVPAPDFAAADLGVASGDPVVLRSRRFEVDGRPVQLADSYIPVDLARGTGIVYHDTGPGGVYARLAESGHAPDRFVERVIGRPPLPAEIEGLNLRRGRAMILEITRTAWSKERCVELARMVLDAEAYEITYEFHAE